jgi:hypothetical protein
VFGDEQAHGWDFKELASFDTRRLRRVERGAAAAALRGRVGEDLVGAGLRQAGRAAVAGLAASLLACAPAQASGAPHAGRVGGGRPG